MGDHPFFCLLRIYLFILVTTLTSRVGSFILLTALSPTFCGRGRSHHSLPLGVTPSSHSVRRPLVCHYHCHYPSSFVFPWTPYLVAREVLGSPPVTQMSCLDSLSPGCRCFPGSFRVLCGSLGL